MRIGIDAHYVGVREGGNERYCESFIRRLGTRGHPEHEYFVFSYKAAARERIGNGRLTHLPLKRRSVAWQRAVEVPLYCRKLDLDVLHVPFNFVPVFRCRKVITIHDLTFIHLPRTHFAAERARMRLMTALAVRHADHVLTVSEFTRQDIVESYGVAPDRITVAPNAADPDVFRPLEAAEQSAFRRSWGLAAPFVLWVGIMTPRKNVATLVEAFARLRERGRTDHELVLVGRLGWLYEDVFRLIRERRLERVVRHVDEVGPRDLAGFYSAATALVVPSRWESFCIPILEAMSCGCPVVCSNAAAMPEVYGDAALPFDPDAPEELAAQLGRVLDDSALRSDLVRRGFANAARFSWERTACIVDRVYQRVA